MNKETINSVFESYLKEIEISDTSKKRAKESYEALGSFLSQKGYDVTIYPQGSFELGTAIKPITDVDEFDIDIVCEFNNYSVKNITQYELKKLLGNMLRVYTEQYNMNNPEEKKKCWQIHYSKSSSYHIDILPAIKNYDTYYINELIEVSVDESISKTAINITDNTSENYRFFSESWSKSNPKGFCKWFKESMLKTSYYNNMQKFAEDNKCSVESIQMYKIKTPLQKVIQLLKRHRDIMFKNNPKYKPISIIITTLATSCYNGEDNVFDILKSFIDNIHRFIDNDYIKNPTEPRENFANKWKTDYKYKEAFSRWFNKLKKDFSHITEMNNMNDIIDSTSSMFGESIYNKIKNKFNVNNKISTSATIIKEGVKPWKE